jgi:Pentapeptide repeats (8 copies)
MLKRSLPKVKTIRRLLKWAIVILALVAVLGLLQPTLWPGGFGIGKEQSVTSKSVETVVKDAQGNTTKTVETTKNDDGKTLWDWLSLLGVPVSLAVLGYILQQLQQKRAEVLAKEQREIAADETKEEVLQVYFDRLSVLLVDKNLLAIAAKDDQATDEERELLVSAMDVIRARTLSILRRFENDPERKTSVIRFLIEADIISKLKLDLSDVNLNGAILNFADLSGAKLRQADLSGANLKGANLNNANLSGANLRDANLSRVNLNGAMLNFADLSGANLNFAHLRSANFISAKLNFTDLSGADLSAANLRDADINNADLNNAELIGAKLHRANLLNAHNLTVNQMITAKLCCTELPQRMAPIRNRDCKALGLAES